MAGGLVARIFFSSILSDGGQEGLAAPPCARGFYSSILSDGGQEGLSAPRCARGSTPPSCRMEAKKALRLPHALMAFTPPSCRIEVLIIRQLIIIIIKKLSFLCYITYRKCCIYAKLLLTLHLRKILNLFNNSALDNTDKSLICRRLIFSTGW